MWLAQSGHATIGTPMAITFSRIAQYVISWEVCAELTKKYKPTVRTWIHDALAQEIAGVSR